MASLAATEQAPKTTTSSEMSICRGEKTLAIILGLEEKDGEKRGVGLCVGKSDWKLSGSALTGWACGTPRIRRVQGESLASPRRPRFWEDVNIIFHGTLRSSSLFLFATPAGATQTPIPTNPRNSPSSSPCAFTSLLSSRLSRRSRSSASPRPRTRSRLQDPLPRCGLSSFLLFLAFPSSRSRPSVVSCNRLLLRPCMHPLMHASFLSARLHPFFSGLSWLAPQERRPRARRPRARRPQQARQRRVRRRSHQLIRRHQRQRMRRHRKTCQEVLRRLHVQGGVRRSLRQDIQVFDHLHQGSLPILRCAG